MRVVTGKTRETSHIKEKIHEVLSEFLTSCTKQIVNLYENTLFQSVIIDVISFNVMI